MKKKKKRNKYLIMMQIPNAFVRKIYQSSRKKITKFKMYKF